MKPGTASSTSDSVVLRAASNGGWSPASWIVNGRCCHTVRDSTPSGSPVSAALNGTLAWLPPAVRDLAQRDELDVRLDEAPPRLLQFVEKALSRGQETRRLLAFGHLEPGRQR